VIRIPPLPLRLHNAEARSAKLLKEGRTRRIHHTLVLALIGAELATKRLPGKVKLSRVLCGHRHLGHLRVRSIGHDLHYMLCDLPPSELGADHKGAPEGYLLAPRADRGGHPAGQGDLAHTRGAQRLHHLSEFLKSPCQRSLPVSSRPQDFAQEIARDPYGLLFPGQAGEDMIRSLDPVQAALPCQGRSIVGSM